MPTTETGEPSNGDAVKRSRVEKCRQGPRLAEDRQAGSPALVGKPKIEAGIWNWRCWDTRMVSRGNRRRPGCMRWDDLDR